MKKWEKWFLMATITLVWVTGNIGVQAAPYEGDTGYGGGMVPAAAQEKENPAVLVSLNVVDADVRSVLTALARMGGANIVADSAVEGNITVRIQSLDFNTALDLVTKMKGLQYHRVGDVILVGKKGEVSQNFGSMHIFQLKYANPNTVLAAAALALGYTDSGAKAEAVSGAAVSKDATSRIDRQQEEKFFAESNRSVVNRLSVDKATNSLLFYGTQEEAGKIRSMLEKIDIPYQQVSLEAEVIALNKDASKNLGIEWDWSQAPQYPEYDVEYEDVTTTVTDSEKGTTYQLTSQVPRKTVKRKWSRGDGGDEEDGAFNGGIIGFGRTPEGYSYELYYSAKINALVTDGKASILARPNINTLNGREAVINIGGQVPVPKVTMNENTTTTEIEYKDTGIILRYTPQINEDGYITANVYTEVSSPQYVADLKAYRFNKRSADTVVRLRDGETMVIGGLIGSEESKAYSKIPFLGDLPIIGRFFSNVSNTKNESEVMIFLTARIVK